VHIISVENITKNFGAVEALRSVSFHVEEGDFYGLFGPNGAGKTTLLRILTGQLDPDSGEVIVAGISHRDPMELKRRVGIVPEAETPPTFLTAQETLELVCKIREIKDIEPRIEKWIHFFGLEDKRSSLCKDLSKGQRQKVMLASAFIHEPGILFLDEPFINLDPIYQRRVRDYLMKLVDEGRTVFMCTHILEIAEKLCTRVAVIKDGVIVKEGSIEEVAGNGALEDEFMKLVGESAPVIS